MQYRQAPWAIFTKLGAGDGVPGHGKLHGCGFKKCRLIGAKIAKIGNFWYKFTPKRYIPLSNFYKSWYGEELPGPHPRAKFNHCYF